MRKRNNNLSQAIDLSNSIKGHKRVERRKAKRELRGHSKSTQRQGMGGCAVFLYCCIFVM